MPRFLLLVLVLALSTQAGALVVRHDVDDAKYRIPATGFPALVDMPGAGHGVLIAPQWVITAAHTIPENTPLAKVSINGRDVDVERVVLHPGYRTLPKDLIEPAMATGEAMLLAVFLGTSDDIALIRLARPVTDIAPVALYQDSVKPGQVVELVGKGATGNGADGYALGDSHRTALRRAYNAITSAYDRWICYRFDEPPSALPLEGALGNGDSGGPVLVEVGDQWQLAGLASWKVVHGHVLKARYGRYEQVTCNVRLSHYMAWIEGVMSAPSPPSVARAAPKAGQPAELPSVVLPPELDRVLRDYERGWRAGDAKALAALFAEDGFVLQGHRPPVRGRAAIQAAYEGQGGAILRLRALAYSAGDKVGSIIGAYAFGEAPGDIGKFTLTLRRDAGGPWLIVSDMDNLNATPRTSQMPDH